MRPLPITATSTAKTFTYVQRQFNKLAADDDQNEDETGEETNAAQPGSNAKSLRMESRYEVSRGLRGHQAEPLRERIR